MTSGATVRQGWQAGRRRLGRGGGGGPCVGTGGPIAPVPGPLPERFLAPEPVFIRAPI